MREILTKTIELGEHIIVDGVEYVAEEDDGSCGGCDLDHCGLCFLIPCRNGIKLKRVEEQDSLPDSKPGPIMSLYEYPALRDRFAMAALQCFRTDVLVAPEYIAEKVYAIADAMMEVRKR